MTWLPGFPRASNQAKAGLLCPNRPIRPSLGRREQLRNLFLQAKRFLAWAREASSRINQGNNPKTTKLDLSGQKRCRGSGRVMAFQKLPLCSVHVPTVSGQGSRTRTHRTLCRTILRPTVSRGSQAWVSKINTLPHPVWREPALVASDKEIALRKDPGHFGYCSLQIS